MSHHNIVWCKLLVIGVLKRSSSGMANGVRILNIVIIDRHKLVILAYMTYIHRRLFRLYDSFQFLFTVNNFAVCSVLKAC